VLRQFQGWGVGRLRPDRGVAESEAIVMSSILALIPPKDDPVVEDVDSVGD